MSVSKVKDNWPALAKAIEELAQREVLVGVPQVEAPREGDEWDGPMNNATLAYIHDNGSPAANIPARPFMAPGVEKVQDYVTARLESAGRAAMDGDQGTVEVELEKAGMKTQASIRNTINDGIEPELADSTLAARRRRGRTGTVPLVDTGQLRNSIQYVVRKK
jgi:phage gpG-like protein